MVDKSSKSKKLSTTKKKRAYKEKLRKSIHKAFIKSKASLSIKKISDYSEILANTLVRYDQESIESLVDRRILTGDEAFCILKRKLFSTDGLVKKIIAILDAYREANITIRNQDKLLSHFFTIKEINTLKNYFSVLLPSVILHACVHNPTNPGEFLRSVIKTRDEIKKEEEFKDIPTSVILRACVGNPKNP